MTNVDKNILARISTHFEWCSLPTVGNLLSRAAAIAFLVLFGAPTLQAGAPHPILERGFQSDQVYDFNGIDSVNAFNGNLVLTIPLGPRYPVNADFSYGFTLVYNSTIWEYLHIEGRCDVVGPWKVLEPLTEDGCVLAAPNPFSNAGVGWTLTLGELYKGNRIDRDHWLYLAPDGSRHEFFAPSGGPLDAMPQHTVDEAYLRLRQTPTEYVIDHPDGSKSHFVPSDSIDDRYRLTRREDPFGNFVSVTYTPLSSGEKWEVKDNHGRLHVLEFADGAHNVRKLTNVSLAGASGSATSNYALEYSTTNLIPGCPSDGHAQNYDGVPMLNAVHLPANASGHSSSYGMTYADETGLVCSWRVGRLSKIVFPTGGGVEYEYAGYYFPSTQCDVPIKHNPGQTPDPMKSFRITSGISLRKELDSDGTTVLGRTFYRSSGFNWGGRDTQFTSCYKPTVIYTDVYQQIDRPSTGHADATYRLTRTFFDATQGLAYGRSRDETSPDKTEVSRLRSSQTFRCEGLPVTGSIEFHDAPLPLGDYEVPEGDAWDDKAHLWVPLRCKDGAPDWTTPDAVAPKRETFSDWDLHGGRPAMDAQGDWQVESSSTYFHDDTNSGDQYTVTTRSGWDGFGRYRTSTENAFNWPSAKSRTVFTDYVSQITDTGWLFGTYSEVKTTEGGVSSTRKFEFNSTTGFLVSMRSWRRNGQTSNESTDLIVEYSHDGNGNVASEYFIGGDLSSGDPGAVHLITHKYKNGVPNRTEYHDGGTPSSPGRVVLRTLDADISLGGFPIRSRDASGVQTVYGYDGRFRLTSITPQTFGGVTEEPTYITYEDAVNPVKVVVKRGSLTESTFVYDGLGRVFKESMKIPDGVSSVFWRTFWPTGTIEAESTRYSGTGQALGTTKYSDYDIFDRVGTVQAPDSATTSYVYNGNRQVRIRRNGVETAEGRLPMIRYDNYDHLGRLVEVNQKDVDASGTDTGPALVTQYSYDEGGRLVLVKQSGKVDGVEKAQFRTFDYDAAGLMTRESHPELDYDVFYSRFDSRGKPRQRALGSSGTVFDLTFKYDGAERLVQVIQSITDSPMEEFFYRQNGFPDAIPFAGQAADAGNGKLYQTKRHNYGTFQDAVVTETNHYLGLGGRLSKRTVRTGGPLGAPRVVFESSYIHDTLGNPKSIDYPRCLGGCPGLAATARSIHYGYDQGLLSSVGTAPGSNDLASLSYHSNLMLNEIVHRPLQATRVTDTITIDPKGISRPAAIGVTSSSGAEYWASGQFGYDGAGNIGSIGTDQFRYDNEFNRLTNAVVSHERPDGSSNSRTQSYQYDVFGNMISLGGLSLDADPSTNRLSSSDYVYDVAGNLRRHGDENAADNRYWRYSYDALNMMTRALGEGTTRDYLYAAGNERIATLFPSRELWTLREPGAKVLTDVEYTAGGGWKRNEDRVYRGSQLLAAYVTTDSGIMERHYHLDHLGSPRAVTDGNGNLVAKHTYLPYGEELSDPYADAERLKFTGHERDDLDIFSHEYDLDYMHARFYTPWAGRFLSVDPVLGDAKRPNGWNRYQYVENRPTNYVDPDGRAARNVNDMSLNELRAELNQHKRVLEVYRVNKTALAVAQARTRVLGVALGAPEIAVGAVVSSRSPVIGGAVVAHGADVLNGGDPSKVGRFLRQVVVGAFKRSLDKVEGIIFGVAEELAPQDSTEAGAGEEEEQTISERMADLENAIEERERILDAERREYERE